MIGLYNHDHDPERDAAAVEAGSYRHEAHNWCFQHNWPAYDLKDRLGTISVPVLVTVGRYDWITPVSSSETIAALVPDAELVIFEESGHSPQSEEREKFQQVLRDSCPGGAGPDPRVTGPTTGVRVTWPGVLVGAVGAVGAVDVMDRSPESGAR